MKLFLLCLVLPTTVLAEGGLPSQPYLYVEGRAEIEKPADLVTLRFELVVRNADQTKANQEVQAKATTILALLDEKKIAKTDTAASDLKSEPQYENEDDSGRKLGKIVGYRVTRPFSVKVRDVVVFPKLVNELIALGSIEFSGIDSGLTDEKTLQDEIRTKALADAHERADKALKQLGMKIDSVFAVSPIAFPAIHQRMFFGDSTLGAASDAPRKERIPDPAQYRLAPVGISYSVHLIYLISPLK